MNPDQNQRTIAELLANKVTAEGAALLLLMDKISLAKPGPGYPSQEVVDCKDDQIRDLEKHRDRIMETIFECTKVLNDQLGAPKEGEPHQLNLRVLSAAIGCRKWFENEHKLKGWRVPKPGDKIKTLPPAPDSAEAYTTTVPIGTFEVDYLSTWYDQKGGSHFAIYTKPDTTGISNVIPLSLCEPAE